jgi:hypothetical protein
MFIDLTLLILSRSLVNSQKGSIIINKITDGVNPLVVLVVLHPTRIMLLV